MMILSDASLFKTQAFVNGQWVNAANGERFTVRDPATGDTLADVPALSAAEVERAIVAAETAQRAWAAKSAKERAKILRAWNDLMLANLEDLAYLMTREQGKPLNEARGEIRYAASFIDWFAEEARRINGDIAQSDLATDSGLSAVIGLIRDKALPVPVVEFAMDDIVRSGWCAMWVRAFAEARF